MKKIEAFVKPFTVEAIKVALAGVNVDVFRIIQAQELNGVRSHAEVYSGTEYPTDVTPSVLVVVLASDLLADDVVRLLREASQTEQPGEGGIIVTTIERYVRIDEGATAEPSKANHV